ncbi:hypothetical protein D3C86_1787800 [compost metagenome]
MVAVKAGVVKDEVVATGVPLSAALSYQVNIGLVNVVVDALKLIDCPLHNVLSSAAISNAVAYLFTTTAILAAVPLRFSHTPSPETVA